MDKYNSSREIAQDQKEVGTRLLKQVSRSNQMKERTYLVPRSGPEYKRLLGRREDKNSKGDKCTWESYVFQDKDVYMENNG